MPIATKMSMSFRNAYQCDYCGASYKRCLQLVDEDGRKADVDICVDCLRVAHVRASGHATSPSIQGSSNNQPNNNSMTIREKLRNAFLKGTDKVLVNAGLENPAGTPTPEGELAMRDFLYRKHRDELAKEVSSLPSDEDEK